MNRRRGDSGGMKGVVLGRERRGRSCGRVHRMSTAI